jgi:hypothetical protein
VKNHMHFRLLYLVINLVKNWHHCLYITDCIISCIQEASKECNTFIGIW